MKLKALKQSLKDLNERKYSHISERVKRKEEEVTRVQSEILGLGGVHVDQDLKRLKDELTNLKTAEKSFYSQRAKCVLEEV